MGKKKELDSTGERVENLMEFQEDGTGLVESDFECDDGRRRSFRSSKKIIPETDPEIQGFSDQIFGNFQEVGETVIEGENDEMGKTISSSSSRRFSSSPKVEKTFLQGMRAIRLSRWFIHRKRIRLLPQSQIPKTKTTSGFQSRG